MKRRVPIAMMLLSVFFFTICAEEKPIAKIPPPKGFVDIKELIPDIVLDIRYATTNNFVGEVLDGYEAPRAFMLAEAAGALKHVQASLVKQGYSLKVFDAYRPMRAERHMLRWAAKNNKKELLDAGYLPTVNPDKIISHSCGNAIDLTIIDKEGKELDMGTTFDYFGKEAWTMNAKGDILENRLFLKSEMEKEGFRFYKLEWWHFTYPKTPNKSSDYIIQ
ncbi:MAG: D-alanyl-D-alanine carboxypeptidase family protein [Spirochaetales bacterium]|nr:D-alanyl-D-alanine carboxypeptidase family protein [Spirochaetales bacterium]